MAASKKDRNTPSRASRKAPEKSLTRSRSGSKASPSATNRAQPKATGSSKAATKSMALPTKARSAARSDTTSTAQESAANMRDASRGTASRRTPSQVSTSGAQNWLASIESMITTREGREIMAEALRAVASVLDNHNRRERDGLEAGTRQDSTRDGSRRFGEALDQGMHTSDPVTNPAAEMVSEAFGVAQATTDLMTDAATGVLLGGVGTSEGENGGREARRGTGKRRSSRKRTP